MGKQELLRKLPSVDEALKSTLGERLLARHPRRFVLDAVRETIDSRRQAIASGQDAKPTLESMSDEIDALCQSKSSLGLRPVINATGIVIHTNLGRSALSARAIMNLLDVAKGYSTLEYDLEHGARGKRATHVKRLMTTLTAAEDAAFVNNNAAAVMLALRVLAEGREVIVSRGELVEIGGSFRVPEVMAQSGAMLREVGATNKTHLKDYERALSDRTGLILKVHRSNFRIEGFTEDVPLAELVALGRSLNVPVMYDMGSGCLFDMKPYGIHIEQTVQEMAATGADVITFSGDKLLGGPQAGIIIGRAEWIQRMASHPLMRALRLDKLALAALEATLMDYADIESAVERIPTLRMLLEPVESVRKRARKLATRLRRTVKAAEFKVVDDITFSGGGALPAYEIKSAAVAVTARKLTANQLEERLRLGGELPVIARIRDGVLLLDARTVSESEIVVLVSRVAEAVG